MDETVEDQSYGNTHYSMFGCEVMKMVLDFETPLQQRKSLVLLIIHLLRLVQLRRNHICSC